LEELNRVVEDQVRAEAAGPEDIERDASDLALGDLESTLADPHAGSGAAHYPGDHGTPEDAEIEAALGGLDPIAEAVESGKDLHSPSMEVVAETEAGAVSLGEPGGAGMGQSGIDLGELAEVGSGSHPEPFSSGMVDLAGQVHIEDINPAQDSGQL